MYPSFGVSLPVVYSDELLDPMSLPNGCLKELYWMGSGMTLR